MTAAAAIPARFAAASSASSLELLAGARLADHEDRRDRDPEVGAAGEQRRGLHVGDVGAELRARRRRRCSASAGCRGWRPSRPGRALAELGAQLRASAPGRAAPLRLRAFPGRPRRAPRRPSTSCAEVELGAGAGAAADPDRPPHPQLGQVGEHQGGARPAHPGRLHGQLAAGRGQALVAPEPARVVAHLRLLEQLLGKHQRAAGVADQDRVSGDWRYRAKSGRHRRPTLSSAWPLEPLPFATPATSAATEASWAAIALRSSRLRIHSAAK